MTLAHSLKILDILAQEVDLDLQDPQDLPDSLHQVLHDLRLHIPPLEDRLWPPKPHFPTCDPKMDVRITHDHGTAACINHLEPLMHNRQICRLPGGGNSETTLSHLAHLLGIVLDTNPFHRRIRQQHMLLKDLQEAQGLGEGHHRLRILYDHLSGITIVWIAQILLYLLLILAGTDHGLVAMKFVPVSDLKGQFPPIQELCSQSGAA